MRVSPPVPASLIELASQQADLVSTAQAVATGVTRSRRDTLVRSGQWHRITRGVYAIVGADSAAPTPPVARARAAWTALLAYGPSAVAVGVCALALHGVAGLPTTIAPQAAVPGGRDRQDRSEVRLREFDNGMETVEIAGRRVATVEWALAQSVPELDRRHGVAVMDSVLHLSLIDREGLGKAHRLARGRRGVAKTHEWWCLADGRAESPLETFGRLDCLDLGVPPDDLQVPVLDQHGRLLGRGDMGWRLERGRWLIAEMDGREPHESPEALFYDRRRQNDIVQVADVLRFTSKDVYAGTVGTTVQRHLRLHRAPSTGRTRGYAGLETSKPA